MLQSSLRTPGAVQMQGRKQGGKMGAENSFTASRTTYMSLCYGWQSAVFSSHLWPSF